MEKEELKKIILQELPRLIEKDPELREAVLRISREHFAPREETRDRFDQLLEEIRQMRLESERKWAEDIRRWEEQTKQWQDNQRRWEEQTKQWQDNQRRWEEQTKQWQENQEQIRKLIAAIEKVDQKGDTRLGALGARWGLYTEQAFRNALQAMLQEFAGLDVIHVTEWDAEGEVFGYPEEIELDLIIKNGVLILGEIKSSVSKGEMYLFVKKVHFYEKLHNRKADRLVIISPMVEPKALEVAHKLGIQIYTHASDAGETLSQL
ncbi:MAG: hypothetical protein DDG59_01605 [Anaerolineae bacterium]|nr:MAG: hypothetical protein DDG59_01605 [Anaerolineae bacterium]